MGSSCPPGVGRRLLNQRITSSPHDASLDIRQSWRFRKQPQGSYPYSFGLFPPVIAPGAVLVLGECQAWFHPRVLLITKGRGAVALPPAPCSRSALSLSPGGDRRQQGAGPSHSLDEGAQGGKEPASRWKDVYSMCSKFASSGTLRHKDMFVWEPVVDCRGKECEKFPWLFSALS